MGKAFQNANTNTSFNINTFKIRYYTWPDGITKPSIVAGSDDWCFLKQDSSRLPSSSLTFTSFTSTYYTPHSTLIIPDKIYVNEWEPAHYFVSNSSHTTQAKTPFEFKMISPTSFSNKDGTNDYHNIELTYNSYYVIPTLNQQSNDLFYYVPTCHLNGFAIHRCTIASGRIKMEFQQPIANGEEVSVRFSIVNPYNEQDEGFTLSNVASGTVTMPMTISVYGSTTYYVEVEPFHPFYKATSLGATYPSQGISNVVVVAGTHAQRQLNYLEFTITLTRNDINSFVL